MDEPIQKRSRTDSSVCFESSLEMSYDVAPHRFRALSSVQQPRMFTVTDGSPIETTVAPTRSTVASLKEAIKRTLSSTVSCDAQQIQIYDQDVQLRDADILVPGKTYKFLTPTFRVKAPYGTVSAKVEATDWTARALKEAIGKAFPEAATCGASRLVIKGAEGKQLDDGTVLKCDSVYTFFTPTFRVSAAYRTFQTKVAATDWTARALKEAIAKTLPEAATCGASRLVIKGAEGKQLDDGTVLNCESVYTFFAPTFRVKAAHRSFETTVAATEWTARALKEAIAKTFPVAAACGVSRLVIKDSEGKQLDDGTVLKCDSVYTFVTPSFRVTSADCNIEKIVTPAAPTVSALKVAIKAAFPSAFSCDPSRLVIKSTVDAAELGDDDKLDEACTYKFVEPVFFVRMPDGSVKTVKPEALSVWQLREQLGEPDLVIKTPEGEILHERAAIDPEIEYQCEYPKR